MPRLTAPDGTELAYHVRGEGDPLIVLPGGPMRASAYLGDLGGLAAHRRLILLDLRGTGDSAVPADPATYRCDRQVDDVEALRAHLGLERVDVLAHSAGSNLATLYAARHPRRVSRLALITATPWALGLPVTVEDRLAAARLREDEPWFADVYPHFEAAWTGRGPFDDAMMPFFYGRWDAAAEAHMAAEVAQTNDDAADAYGSAGAYDPEVTRAALTELTAPVLYLGGALDTGPPPRLVRQAAGLFPEGEYSIQPGAGHFPWLDDPEWFVRRVTTFLAGDESVVERTWRMLREGHPEARRGCPEVIEAAFAEPRLRGLYPFPSHGALFFHRNTDFPWSNDLPHIATGFTGYVVYAARSAEILGETATPEEAAALVVAHLPDDCGPAVEGPWPEPAPDPST
jgi:pimeloyl-ACP methyl ester carboxylesterase